MLSNFTNYLFGSQPGNAMEVQNENVDFHEIEDDDWTVVHKLGEKNDNGDDLIVNSETFIVLPTQYANENPSSRPPIPDKSSSSSRRRSISCKRLASRRCSTPLRELSPACVNSKAVVPYVSRKESRSSSKSSSCAMEESWYITPPPCFVSGPYDTKPSSMENLLIEQPGVSLGQAEKESLEKTGVAKKQFGDVAKLGKKKVEVSQTDEKRRQIIENHEQKRFFNTCQNQLSAAQKVEQKVTGQFIKRNQIDRSNKVQYELSSRKKRQRRSDLNKKHSGVNNNRKCCY